MGGVERFISLSVGGMVFGLDISLSRRNCVLFAYFCKILAISGAK
jgi:hypothetical protein